MVGLASRQLRHYRVRTLLAVLGVAVAVLLVVMLGGLGHGMLTTGDEAIAWIDYDLWATSGPVTLAPGGVGSVANPVHDAHRLSRDLETHDSVRDAQPYAFQTVYVSPDDQGFNTIVGVGVGGNASQIHVGHGHGFNHSDVHYANGTYVGPMTHAIIVDERTAEQYNLSVGDTLHAGATLAAAREHEFTVVGITRSFQTFLGVPTVTMHLSELQEVSGATGTDRASLIALALEPNAEPAVVQRDLERTYSNLAVRTNDQQVQDIIGGHTTVIAGAVTLVVLAVVVGVLLVVNVLTLLVYQQRKQLAALKASGVSGSTLLGIVTVQGALTGLLGGVVGLAVTPLAVVLLNDAVGQVTGFSKLIKTPWWLLAAGLCLALTMGVLGASLAGWRVARLSPLEHLRQ